MMKDGGMMKGWSEEDEQLKAEMAACSNKPN